MRVFLFLLIAGSSIAAQERRFDTRPDNRSDATPSRTVAEADREIRQLREDLKALLATRDSISTALEALDNSRTDEISQMRQELRGLVDWIKVNGLPQLAAAERAAAQAAKEPRLKASSDVRPTVLSTQKAIDPLAWGRTLFRQGNFVDALTALRQVDQNAQSARGKMLTQYLIATALRKMAAKETDTNRQAKLISEAESLYQKVVASKTADLQLADYARWQLGSIRWAQNAQKEITQLRKEVSEIEIEQP